MGYHLNRLDESVFTAVSKPLLTEFGIHHRLESGESSSYSVNKNTRFTRSRVTNVKLK